MKRVMLNSLNWLKSLKNSKCLMTFIFLCSFLILFLILSCCFAKEFNSRVDIAIIGAMDCEINDLERLLKNKKTNIKNETVLRGKIGKNRVIIAKSGVGKVRAGARVQYLIDKYNPRIIINTGIAGALNDELKIADLIIVKDSIQHDFDISYFGYAKGYMSTGIKPNEPSLYSCNCELVDFIEKYIEKLSLKKGAIKRGRIASGDVFVSDYNVKKKIREEFKADAVDMESAAIIQVANMNNVPCVVIRAISDLADGDKNNNYSKLELETAQLSARIIGKILQEVDFGNKVFKEYK